MSARAQLQPAVLRALREGLGRYCGLRLDEVSDAALDRAAREAAARAGMTDADAFAEAVRTEPSGSPRLLQHLVRRVTVGETHFFRHPEDLDWIQRSVFPAVREARGAAKRIRIWSAGCATGEEAYTLAIIALQALPADWDIWVLATDINDDSLERARQAQYGEWSFRGVAPEMRARWFEEAGPASWRPVEQVRRRVVFDYLNLRDPIYPAIFSATTDLDLIVCRNVFIYFYPETIRDVFLRMSSCLLEPGFLLCGPSDPFPSEGSGFFSEDSLHRLRRRSGNEPSRRPRPSFPRAVARPPRLPAAPPPAQPALKPTPSPPASREDPLSLLRSGRYPAAIEELSDRLRTDPLSVEANRQLALALTAERSASAVEAWKKLLYLAPLDPQAHLGLGMSLVRDGKRSEARRHFRAALQFLEGKPDQETLPGPDPIPIGWVRAACRSLQEEGDVSVVRKGGPS